MNFTDYRARDTNDIKHFIKDFFRFRLYIVFKDTNARKHFYGNEQSCTLSQVRNRRVPFVELSMQKGYGDLIQLVEKKWHGKYTSATIYARDEDGAEFSKICRSYYKGVIQDCQDPILTAETDIRHLYFQELGEEIVFATTPFPDFKKELETHLSTRA